MRWFYPSVVWKIKTNEKTIFLTFDDGPIPIVTDFVLETLANFNAKATFFCVGDNIVKFNEVFNEVINQGHSVANHTHNHLNGWKTNDEEYLQNIKICGQHFLDSKLGKMFRPPYGKITKKQIQLIDNQYVIIFWDVLVGDFDLNLSPQIMLEKAIKNTENGSIVVFHDSQKAFQNMKYVLPKYLKHFKNLGYKFELLEYYL